MYSKTYNDISKKLREAKYEDDHLLTPARPDMTLDEWFDIWVSTCKKNCRDTTLRTYKINYNQLKGELGWRKLKDLNLVILQGAINELGSDQSRRNCKALMVDILGKAVDSDLVSKNVATKVNTKIDCLEKRERHVLSQTEINALYLAMGCKSSIYPIVVVALNTGM